ERPNRNVAVSEQTNPSPSREEIERWSPFSVGHCRQQLTERARHNLRRDVLVEPERLTSEPPEPHGCREHDRQEKDAIRPGQAPEQPPLSRCGRSRCQVTFARATGLLPDQVTGARDDSPTGLTPPSRADGRSGRDAPPLRPVGGWSDRSGHAASRAARCSTAGPTAAIRGWPGRRWCSIAATG